jgi:hypothetical protein
MRSGHAPPKEAKGAEGHNSTSVIPHSAPGGWPFVARSRWLRPSRPDGRRGVENSHGAIFCLQLGSICRHYRRQ